MAKSKSAAKSKAAKSKASKASKPQTIMVLSVQDRNEARRELARIFKSDNLTIQERNALRRAQRAQFKGKV